MIDLAFHRDGKSGNTKIVATTPGGQSFTLRADLVDPTARARAVEELHKQFPGQDKDGITEKLEAMAARTTERGETIAERLLAHLRQPERLQLFHSPDLEPHAFVRVAADTGDWESMHVRGASFRRWVARESFLELHKAPNNETLGTVIATLEGEAQFSSPERPVFVRVGSHRGMSGREVWLDLADPKHQLVRVTEDGWKIIPARVAPVRFLRPRGLLALPLPERGGSISDLRPFVNVDDRQWMLLVAFLVMTLRPSGPYPILMVSGEQGSAKSTLGRVLRLLVDPNKADNRRPPKDPQSLAIAAKNSWLLSFDNLSGVQPWLSDDLCSLVYGAGFATRELYADGEEVIFSAARPVMLNGIEDLGARADLADRSIQLVLRTIGESERREESEFWAAFERARPRLVGALLSAVSIALRRESGIRLDRKPRMADFAKWVEAAAPGLGLAQGAFIDAYSENRSGMSAIALESAPFALAVREFVEGCTTWTGSATELLAAVTTPDRERLDGWPKSGRKVQAELRRSAPALRAAGIEFQADGLDPKTRRTRYRLFRQPTQSFDSFGPSWAATTPGSDEQATNGLNDVNEGADGAAGDPHAEVERRAIWGG